MPGNNVYGYISNSQANALFDITKLILGLGVTSTAAIIFYGRKNDLNGYLLYRRGLAAFGGDVKNYKVRNKMNMTFVVLLILISTIVGFIPTILASLFPVQNYVLSMGLLTNSTKPLFQQPMDASGLNSSAEAFAGLLCNSTELCIVAPTTNGNLLNISSTMAVPYDILVCTEFNQPWCVM